MCQGWCSQQGRACRTGRLRKLGHASMVTHLRCPPELCTLWTRALLYWSNTGQQEIKKSPIVGACDLRRARPASIPPDNPSVGHLQARPSAAPAFEMPPLWQACSQAVDRQAGPARQSQPPSLWLPAASCPVRSPSCGVFTFTLTSSDCMRRDPSQSSASLELLHSLPVSAPTQQQVDLL